jgi:hypothetical protein
MGVLMWVPADWVAAGMTGFPDTDVEIELYVPSFFATPASIEAVGVPVAREQAEAYLRGDPLRNVISGTY